MDQTILPITLTKSVKKNFRLENAFCKTCVNCIVFFRACRVNCLSQISGNHKIRDLMSRGTHGHLRPERAKRGGTAGDTCKRDELLEDPKITIV